MFYKEIWTDKEKIMITRLCTILEQKRMVEIHKQLHESLVALEYQAIALSLYPLTQHSNRLGGKVRNLETLVEMLSEKYHEEDMFVMPSKAMLSRSYEVSKINTLYMVKHIIDDLSKNEIYSEADDPLTFVCNRILSIMTEDVLLGLLGNPLRTDIKSLAVKSLAEIWEDRTSSEWITFDPELRNMWLLRQASVPIFGCMTGTHEYFSLCKFANDVCLKYILYSAEMPEEASALEEFLFGLNYEQLCTVKEFITETGKGSINRSEVTKLLNIDKIFFSEVKDDPMELYRFFNHRRKKALSRRCFNLNGPLCTFEENFMAYLLLNKTEHVSVSEESNSLSGSIP